MLAAFLAAQACAPTTPPGRRGGEVEPVAEPAPAVAEDATVASVARMGPPVITRVSRKGPDAVGPIPRHLPPAFRREWRPEWSHYVARAIDRHSPELIRPSKLPLAEIKQFCPGFVHATPGERKAFWAAVFAAISRYESTFNPRARTVEPFADPETHRPEVSEGLLQLAYSDRLNHPDCKADRARGNLVDPEVNIDCGVAIMRGQIEHRRTLFPDHFYYWSVLTKPKLVRRVKTWLRSALKNEPYCKA